MTSKISAFFLIYGYVSDKIFTKIRSVVFTWGC